MIRQAVKDRFSELRSAMMPPWMRLFVLAVSILATAFAAGFRLNVSNSLPIGLYRTVRGASVVERGSIVMVCLPEAWSQLARQRRFLGHGRCPGGSYALGKVVVAIEGDVVTISRNQLVVGDIPLVNGHTLASDHLDRALPHYPWGSHSLGPGQLWLYSCHPAAFDSRYFGPVNRASVRSTVLPVSVDDDWQSKACSDLR